MADIFEYECKECLDSEKTSVRAANIEIMRKHVAVHHCGDEYRTHKCGRCQKRYFDIDHFLKHLNTSPKCAPMILTVEPLDKATGKAFDFLVAQIARQIDTVSVGAPTPPGSQGSKSEEPIVIDLEAEETKDNEIALMPRSSPAPTSPKPLAQKKSPIPTTTAPEPKPGTKPAVDATTSDAPEGNKECSRKKLPGKKMLNLCQLCIELENGRGPIFDYKKKEAHALMHLKFSPAFANMTDSCARARPEFQKVIDMCFRPGFYKQLKREENLA